MRGAENDQLRCKTHIVVVSSGVVFTSYVPLWWVGFSHEIPKLGSHFLKKKKKNPETWVRFSKIFGCSLQNGLIFREKSLKVGTFFCQNDTLNMWGQVWGSSCRLPSEPNLSTTPPPSKFPQSGKDKRMWSSKERDVNRTYKGEGKNYKCQRTV